MSRYVASIAITSHDVARLAGVSQPTVSRALRDQRGVSETTRAKVRAAAKELGYVSNQAGRALSTRATGRVGVVSAELGNPFYPALLEPLHDALDEHGYRMILVTDRGDLPVEVEPLIDGSLDGVVLTTCTRDSPLPEELRRRGLPYVMLNRVVPGVNSDSCTTDNAAGSRLVADFLIELGHRKIAAIHGPEGTSTGHDRARAFAGRLRQHGLMIPDRWRHRGPFADTTGSTGLRRIFAGADTPTAVFCANDVIALGVLNAAHEIGISIPSDLTVIGMDDIPMAAWPMFGLTTLRTDLRALAHRAAQLLTWRLREPGRPPEHVVLAPELVRRATHGPPG
jgi:LacI family transcriptional regulator